jgi:hypothetical protein
VVRRGSETVLASARPHTTSSAGGAELPRRGEAEAGGEGAGRTGS